MQITKSVLPVREFERLKSTARHAVRGGKYSKLIDEYKTLKAPGDQATGKGDWLKVVLADEHEVKLVKAFLWKYLRTHSMPKAWVLTDTQGEQPVLWITLHSEAATSKKKG
jgi:hypothetical protein